ncbi:MAG TPA: hypothetical protein VL854_06820 [Nitrososphaeraceae archaeon]|jgi:hypothetical protein|nr:hypothetical protein [Nitrososphaeraceae archaeon]
MKLRLERKLLEIDKEAELPDWSFNHYYNFVGPNHAEVYYLVPSTEADAEKCHYAKSQKEIP